MKLIKKAGAIAIASVLAATAFAASAAAAALNGAGSTAIYPVLAVWAKKYQGQSGTAVNYQAIGSGGGIAQIKAKTVDFGASDKPLKHDDLVANHLMQFPMAIISIVPVIHVPGIGAGQLVLDGPTLANIYLGNIKKWNDPAIARLNPGLKLPNLAIITVHRSDGSGTTFNYTDYLAKVSPEWKTKVGSDTSVTWPASDVGGKGNAGVAASVQQINGSIGYVEYAYAKANNLVYADMINMAGKRVAPTLAAFQAAASNADFTKVQDFYLILTDQPGDASWPIMGSTWVIARTDYPPARNKTLANFCDWALRNGQADAISLDYVPVPENAIKLIEVSWLNQLHVAP